MYKLGYIDDEKQQFENFKKKINRYDNELELCWIQGSNHIQEIIDEILKEQVDALLVDYKMAKSFGFNGSKLVSQMNDYILDLPCFILTQVDKKEINDGLVETRDIFPKTVFDTEGQDPGRIEELKKQLRILKESAKVFRARMEDKEKEYKSLLEEREKGNLKDESMLCKLYEVLSSYGYVEKLPQSMLGSDIQNQLMDLIQMGQKIIQQHEGKQ